ncbi:sensor histidine kinase KdpD [Leptospira bandrabouensis]|uniref:sensor histidine kinase n=1 Tax=Leptospira bandrabouensis TaxID=2484903 RepID=UPI00223D9167|nr:sensor histidine kinase KdpD [Leptospira bandrabouensis]MCW7457839.1 sensor histidine kinase KdpD [Leptospira bandrabouensis]MCW7477421.1 sensor histidine kinase KdpD [Leptospira bandrabouensis]MCW7485103.1 sensor histidine kinase KdpD [Leptospira bandrabouensis]
MNEGKRPEDFLSLANQEETKKTGILKVYFGMSPGVGKTYAMLIEAHQLKADGEEVKIGIVESHGREDTKALVEGIDKVPLKKIEYKGKVWEEMDVESILKEKPKYVLVDELAHTNIPGSINKKRYQDVFLLLDAGINVLSTVNVQHLESQVDSIEKIIQSPVKETIPDSILERADELVLIDIIPDELLKRLSEGKVYIPEKIISAKENFFKKENLTYLRELSLSYTAKYVEKRMPQGRERILVAISASPHSKTLLRYAKKLALERNSELYVFFSENEEDKSVEAANFIRSHIRFAKELGAEVVHSFESDPVVGIVTAAREKRINRLLIGGSKKSFFGDLFQKNISSKIIKQLRDVEIIIVPSSDDPTYKIDFYKKLIPSSGIRQYISVFALTSLVTLCNQFLNSFIGYWTISILYLFYVALLGMFFSRGPVLLAAILSASFWNFLFIPPLYTFYISKLEDALMFFIFMLIALINGSLTARLKKNESKLRSREEKLSILYELTQNLSKTSTASEIIKTGDSFFKRIFPFPVKLHFYQGGEFSPAIEDTKDLAVATWTIKNGKPAGKYTETLSLSNATFYPLVSPGGITGVIKVVTNEEPSLEKEILLNTVANQVALALDRDILSEDSKKNFLLKESEKLYNLVFNSLSHELKTPLTSIQGSASALLDPEIDANPIVRKDLVEEIQESSLVLNLLLGNLLDISRIESGYLTLKKEKVHPSEIIHDSISYLGKNKTNHSIKIQLNDLDIPIELDRVLFSHAIFNLLYNACMYTQSGSTIWISLTKTESSFQWIVEDNGNGLPLDTSRIFQKFYRGESSGKIGTGLGLAISKSIIELHGGSIEAMNRKEGGARFLIDIPYF